MRSPHSSGNLVDEALREADELGPEAFVAIVVGFGARTRLVTVQYGACRTKRYEAVEELDVFMRADGLPMGILGIATPLTSVNLFARPFAEYEEDESAEKYLLSVVAVVRRRLATQDMGTIDVGLDDFA